MATELLTWESPVERLSNLRSRVVEARQRAERLIQGGATGIHAAAALSESVDQLLLELLADNLQSLNESERKLIERHAAVVAVGGTGRGDLCPYSDVDLLFLFEGTARDVFARWSSQAVRDCWDAGLKLGHAVRTLRDTVSLARRDIAVATALVEARHLWGNESLTERLKRRFLRRVVRSRLHAFCDECVASRFAERQQFGEAVCQLEPDVKRSLGGLRDIHLIRWLGYAQFGTADLESLRLEGALHKADARKLLAAQEFLTRVRVDLHLASGKDNDVLTREEQLRIAEDRQVGASSGQRPVERFMQTYFQHSTAIAEISSRFAELHQPRTVRNRIVQFVTTHRADGVFRIGNGELDVVDRDRPTVCRSLERLLKLFQAAALNDVVLSPSLCDDIKHSITGLLDDVSPEAARIFLEILKRPKHLGPILRQMYETGVLERVLPELTHTRCLLQFNQYHSYTVDEHTLRAVEAAQSFTDQGGPVGAAYAEIRHNEILHLALLLHDAGKGFGEDHSEVGRRLAERVATRLRLSDELCEMLTFLVHQHLMMSHLAFRRDISDPAILFEFSQKVGSPETLHMLYVLTAADLSAVGPNVWTDWKADLLSELYDRALLILSGKHLRFLEEERLQRVRQQVRNAIVHDETVVAHADEDDLHDWFDTQFDAFSPHYLTTTPPQRVAADLKIIHNLQKGKIVVEGQFDVETGTVDYRIITGDEFSTGCFYRLVGVLAAKRHEILSAQICTTHDGVVVDVFKVVDHDYSGEVPQSRINEVADAIRRVLTGQIGVEELFQRSKRFGERTAEEPLSQLPTRVVLDNDSSERCTIVDVFAHDRPGLLYTVSRTLFQLDLSIVLAKISTHLDQVVDVFHVTDSEGQKIDDPARLAAIRKELTENIREFERSGKGRFV